MQFKALNRGELIAIVGGILLGISLFLAWYTLGNEHARLHERVRPQRVVRVLHHRLEADRRGLGVDLVVDEEELALLEERGALMARQEIHHSYPHCWRCHRPVIFRATEQWFINMETPMAHANGSVTTFRQRAVEEIDRVKWDPGWGKERITNMVSTRPD